MKLFNVLNTTKVYVRDEKRLDKDIYAQVYKQYRKAPLPAIIRSSKLNSYAIESGFETPMSP